MEQKRKLMFTRNVYWIIPVLIATVGGLIFIFMSIVMGIMKKSTPFDYSLNKLEQSDIVTKYVGDDFDVSYFVWGNVSVQGEYGFANFKYEISGNDNQADVIVKGIKNKGKWKFETFYVVLDSENIVIDVMQDKKAQFK